jgi:DNA-binding transcriptional regulator YdaS (Cro superfamily)
MPVATAEKVRALSRDLGSQRKLAELLDVSPAQVTRWIQGRGIDDLNADRVDLLELVMSQLLRLYTPDVAAMWLRGLNPHLRDRRPIDLIRRGRSVEVLDVISQERAGSFA